MAEIIGVGGWSALALVIIGGAAARLSRRYRIVGSPISILEAATQAGLKDVAGHIVSRLFVP